MEIIRTNENRKSLNEVWFEDISKGEEKAAEAKERAAEYSLSLIKASLDHLEESTDAEKMRIAMKELNKPSERSIHYPCSDEMIKELIKDHERIMTTLKKKISTYYERLNDTRLADFIKSVIEEHKAMAWILKKHLIR